MALSLLCVSSVSGNWICSVCLVSCQIAGIGFGEGHLCATEIVPGDNMGWIKFISKSVAVFPYNLPSLLKLSFNGDKADKYLMRISGLCSHSGTVTIITSKIDFRFKPRSFCQHVDTGESRQVPRGAAWLANTPCFSHAVKQTLIATVVAVVGLASQRNTQHAPSLLQIWPFCRISWGKLLLPYVFLASLYQPALFLQFLGWSMQHPVPVLGRCWKTKERELSASDKRKLNEVCWVILQPEMAHLGTFHLFLSQ